MKLKKIIEGLEQFAEQKEQTIRTLQNNIQRLSEEVSHWKKKYAEIKEENLKLGKLRKEIEKIVGGDKNG